MTPSALRFTAIFALACLFVSVCSTAMAATAAGPLLREAYVTLERADHDYKGHRKQAMEAIEKAAKEVGMNVRGDGGAHEKQGISDEHLREAENLLREARGGLRGKALKHVNRALGHLSTALKIK
jgi:hypothetical protein